MDVTARGLIQHVDISFISTVSLTQPSVFCHRFLCSAGCRDLGSYMEHSPARPASKHTTTESSANHLNLRVFGLSVEAGEPGEKLC